MFAQSSREFKISLILLVAVGLLVIVFFAMRGKNDVTSRDPQTNSSAPTNNSTELPAAPPQNLGDANQSALPGMDGPRDADAPPLVSPEEALRLRGMQSSPSSGPDAPAAPPAGGNPMAPTEAPAAPPQQ